MKKLILPLGAFLLSAHAAWANDPQYTVNVTIPKTLSISTVGTTATDVNFDTIQGNGQLPIGNLKIDVSANTAFKLRVSGANGNQLNQFNLVRSGADVGTQTDRISVSQISFGSIAGLERAINLNLVNPGNPGEVSISESATPIAIASTPVTLTLSTGTTPPPGSYTNTYTITIAE